MVALGKPEDRFSNVLKRLWNMLLYAIGQRRVIAFPFGFNHLVIFWSFLVLSLANADFVIHGIFPGLGIALLPSPLREALFLAFDLVSFATLGALTLAIGRRLLFPPDYIEARSRDAFVILGLIGGLMLAFFASHGAEIASGLESSAVLMPFSALVAAGLTGLPAPGLQALGLAAWWVHALLLLSFLNYLPYSKHMHILTAIPNCYFGSLKPVTTLPREVFEAGREFGADRLDRLTWKDLFDSYACTECGRCTHLCPASATGKPLKPRLVIHDLKVNLLANGPAMLKGKEPGLPLIGESGEGSISEDVIWSCTTCGACMEICPVFIEHVPKLARMRRDLVETRSKFPEELLNLFENMEQRSNPWGIAPGDRTKWSAGIQARPFSAQTEYLFFVGCAGALDSRNRQVSLATAAILDAAGVSWGILGKDEKCCGDSLRRLGNEFVFERMAQENLKLFKARGVKKIITQCPHCFSTLKNDYAQFGEEARFEVIHHSQLIPRLEREGRLKLKKKAGQGRLAYHDSCYLGRHNGIYQEPRQALTQATGQAPVEMSRNRERSFCCGAGGGRMWMEERLGTRINLERVKQALETKPDTIATACPYCMTMFEDGLKDEKADAKIRVKDIAEITAECL